MSEKAQWQNRIVGYADVDPKTLAPNPQNYRRHPKRQGDAVTGSLNELGWIQDVLVNKTTGRMIDGHLRVELALQHGAQSVPVKYVELSEAEERLALATLDPLTYMAETDAAALGALLEGVNTGDAALQEMIAKLAEDNGLFKPEPVQDVEPQIDRAEELRQKWGVSSGDLWALGEHRIICGDCTDAAVVARLMGGEKAQLVLTSPPYGVGMDYEGKPDQSATVRLVTDALTLACELVASNGFAFVNFGERYVWDVPMVQVYHGLFRSIGWRWYDQRFWKRSQVGMAIWNTTQPRAMSQVEYLFTFQNGNGIYPVHDLSISKEQLWDDAGSSAQMGHPAVMALGIATKGVTIYTGAGDLVYEPFSGSGTTIIACEQLGRKCRAVEISPAYVAVAIERWATATGRTPERIP